MTERKQKQVKGLIICLIVLVLIVQCSLGIISIFAMQILLETGELVVEWECVAKILIKLVKWMDIIVPILAYVIGILAIEMFPNNEKDSK